MAMVMGLRTATVTRASSVPVKRGGQGERVKSTLMSAHLFLAPTAPIAPMGWTLTLANVFLDSLAVSAKKA